MRYFQTVIKIDLSKLTEEASKLAWDPNLNDFRRQTAVQNLHGNDDYLDGTGSKPGSADNQWYNLRSDLANTWWSHFFQTLPWPVYRTRIMIMPPRTCYSIHRDTSPRLHIAIKTDEQSRFIFTQPPELIHIPADGYIHWLDTSQEHTAINGSSKSRWHLLMSLDQAAALENPNDH